MAVIYFKRLRMQIDVRTRQFTRLVPPPGYQLHPWQEKLLDAHADAKSRSFSDELDANLFPSLAEPEGCRRLMNEISCRQGFVPQATWLLTYQHPKTGRQENCATVQGIHDQYDIGAIQNIGVARGHRGLGLGSLIIQQCLQGFQQVGIRYVTLEVTAQNTGAIRLYERIGFRVQRIVFKIIEVGDP
jgi:ribosomal protein S18 acetylase RimI-like enzyme